MKLPKLIKQPKIPVNLPKNTKWLAGEGAGSWFVFIQEKEWTIVQRYSPRGNFECENKYKIEVNLENDFKMDYPSHCSIITINYNGEKLRFESIH